MKHVAILPAAGLGTRVRALIGDAAKEMVALGGEPAIAGSLREALAADMQRVVVVVAPDKADLRSWLDGASIAGLDLRIAVQEQPRGVLDAVARGRARAAGHRPVILFPDHVQLPDQRGLQRARDAMHSGCAPAEATWFGLVRMSEQQARTLGPTARVQTTPLGQGRHRIDALLAPRPTQPGALHTFLFEAPGSAQDASLPVGASDADHLPALRNLAEQGLLFGCEIGDDVLDLGWPAGLRAARRRFADGTARWRGELP